MSGFLWKSIFRLNMKFLYQIKEWYCLGILHVNTVVLRHFGINLVSKTFYFFILWSESGDMRVGEERGNKISLKSQFKNMGHVRKQYLPHLYSMFKYNVDWQSPFCTPVLSRYSNKHSFLPWQLLPRKFSNRGTRHGGTLLLACIHREEFSLRSL